MAIGCSNRNVYATAFFDQVEPTRAAMASLVPAIHAFNAEYVDGRVKLRTSGMRVIVKRAPPEDAR